MSLIFLKISVLALIARSLINQIECSIQTYQEFFDLFCDDKLVHFDIVDVSCSRWGRGEDFQGRAEA